MSMGVYHFMGLGRSAGAVTAPLSYLAARFQRDSPEDQIFFGSSGEIHQPMDKKRGDVQALVLFTTADIYNQQIPSYEYVLNQPGRSNGQSCGGEAMPRLLKRLLKKNLSILTETSRDSAQYMQRKSVEVYWCLYQLDRPTQTFERVAATINAAKPVGGLGKEIWINLTGGTNIINSALQLAVSLLGVSARLYYTWTEYPDCIYYTVSKSDLGQKEKDRFWVDLPILYFDFNEHHQCILDTLAALKGETLTLEQLYSFVMEKGQLEKPPGSKPAERLALFQRLYLLPLRAQQLVTSDDKAITLGEGWERLQRYYQAIPMAEQASITLRQLADENEWLVREEWPVAGN